MSREPFSFGNNSGRKKKRSKKQEKSWAHLRKTRRQPNSGALWHSKGDVKDRQLSMYEGFLWENKRTEKYKSYRIKADEWLKIREEAHLKEGGLMPGMEIEICHSSLQKPLELVVLEKDAFLYLEDRIRELENKIKKLEEE